MEVIRGASWAAEAPRGSDCSARVCTFRRPLLECGWEPGWQRPAAPIPSSFRGARPESAAPKLPPVAAPRPGKEQGAAARSMGPRGQGAQHGPRGQAALTGQCQGVKIGFWNRMRDHTCREPGVDALRASAQTKPPSPASLRKHAIPVDLHAKIKSFCVGVFFFCFFSSHGSPRGNPKQRASLGFLCERSPPRIHEFGKCCWSVTPEALDALLCRRVKQVQIHSLDRKDPPAGRLLLGEGEDLK